MSAGIRCAETTSASQPTPNSSSTVTAGSMTGQSESLPMTTLTRAAITPSSVKPGSLNTGSVSPGSVNAERQVPRRVPGPLGHLVVVGAERRHVADLPPRPDLLPVQVDLDAGVGGPDVGQPVPQVRIGPAEDVHHNRAGRHRPRRPERQVKHRPQVLLELRG